MFISVNSKNGQSSCFQIRLVTYSPDLGVIIYGQEENLFILVKKNGNIETADFAESVKIESCELPDFSFFKSRDKEKPLTVTNDAGSVNLTSEDLYHRIKRALWNISQ